MADIELFAPKIENEVELYPDLNPNVSYSPAFKDFLAKTYSVAVDRESNGLRDNIELGFLPAIEEESRYNNGVRVAQDVRRRVENGQTVTVDELERSRPVLDAVDNSIVPDVDRVIFSEGISAEEHLQLATHRLETVKRLFGEQFNQSTGGFFAGVGYFLDTVASDPVDILTGGGFTRENMSNEIARLVNDPSISEVEFQSKVTDLINEASDRGVFSEDNPFYTAQLLEDIEQGASLDKFFTGIGGALLGGAAAKRIVKSVDAVDVITTVANQRRVANEIIKALDVEESGVDTARHLSPNSQRIADQLRSFYSSPDATALRALETNNRIKNIVDDLDWGSVIQPNVWARTKPEIIKNIAEELELNSNRRYISHDVDLGPGGSNPVVSIVFGKSDGTYFVSKQAAQKVATNLNGEVIEQFEDGKTLYGVRIQENVPTKGLLDPTNENELTTHLLQSIGSPMLTTSSRLDAIIKRAEGQIGVINQAIVKNYNKAKRKLPKRDMDFINQLYNDLRDGPLSYRREPLSQEEFTQRYHETYGVEPSSQVLEFHRTIQELNDTAYYVLSDDQFKRAVNDGEKILFANNTGLRVKPVKADEILDPDDVIYNLDTKRTIRSNKTEGLSVFVVKGGFKYSDDLPVKYVATATPKTRKIYHTDVVPYNVGGPRGYENFQFFLKQEREIAFKKFKGKNNPNGTPDVFPGRPVTFMGVVTQNEAMKAVDDLNAIFDGLKKQFGLVDSHMFNNLQILRSQNDNTDLIKFINQHNDWNPNIETPNDLANFLEKFNLDINKKIGFAKSGEVLRTVDDVGHSKYISGLDNAGETVDDQFVRMSNGKPRRDEPLLGYGGSKADVFNPVDASQRAFTKAINFKAEQAYRFNAIEGWLKGAKDYISNWNEIQHLRPYEQLKQARLSGIRESAVFEQERIVIQRRVEKRSGLTLRWERMVNKMGDYVYDKGFKKTGISFKNTFSTDPSVALRSLAFDIHLGMFAFPQLFVQSNQIVNIVAIAGPKLGIPSAASVFPLRLALHNAKLPVVREIGKRAGPFIGLDADQFVELYKFIQRSGRGNIALNVIEQAQDFAFGLEFANRFRQAGRVFFNEGEKLPRLAAATVAYKEFLKQFPGQALTSRQAELWMAQRMDVLTASMTRASATTWQVNSLLSIPLQFMSYSSRMVEQIFTNKILTPKERSRLAAIQLLMWGFGGYGAGSVVNHLVNEGHLEVDNDTYTLLRYGLLDYIVGQTTGARTAFGERFSFGEGFFDIYRKVTDEQFLEVIGGPSVSLVKDLYSKGLFLMGDVVHGRTDMMEYDATRLIRSLSSVNTLYNSWTLFQLGEYYSRNGRLLADHGGMSEAIFNLMGGQMQDIALSYDLVQYNQRKEELLKERGERIQELVTVAQQKYNEGDFEGGENLLKDAGALMTILSPHDREKIMFYLEVPTTSFAQSILMRAFEKGENLNIANQVLLDPENVERRNNN